MAMVLMVGVRYPSMTSEHGETPLEACLDLKILGEHRTTLFSEDDLPDERRQSLVSFIRKFRNTRLSADDCGLSYPYSRHSSLSSEGSPEFSRAPRRQNDGLISCCVHTIIAVVKCRLSLEEPTRFSRELCPFDGFHRSGILKTMLR